eukprot:12311905-Alexandrium_andersonii.AAC.1
MACGVFGAGRSKGGGGSHIAPILPQGVMLPSLRCSVFRVAAEAAEAEEEEEEDEEEVAIGGVSAARR